MVIPYMSPLYLIILRAIFSISIPAVALGIFHRYDAAIAAVLVVYLAWKAWTTYLRNPSRHRVIVLVFGALLTGTLGILAEIWGIHNGHWSYHDLPNGQTFARWLPMAWMMGFIALYRVEESLILRLELTSRKSKLLLVALISMLLPVLGEAIAINLGVWTYAWGYQLFGVPLLAIVLLVVGHLLVYMTLMHICRRYRINDTVFHVSE